MKNLEKLTWNYEKPENRPGTMKNQPKPLKTDMEPRKTKQEP